MYLEWLDNDGELARLVIDPAMEAVTIGRSPASTLYAKETSVSRNHARIGWEPAGYYLKDLGSANGSFINGERVQRGALRPGDVARCGEVMEIRVCPGSPPDAVRAESAAKDSAPRRIPRPTTAVSSADTPQHASQLETQLTAARAAVATLQGDVKAVEARSMRYSLELDGLSGKYVKLKEHNQILSQELERTRAELRSREDEVFDSGRAVDELKVQLDLARQKAAEATEQLSGLKVRVTQKDRQTEELQRQLDLLEYELRAARDENDSLQASFNHEGGDLNRQERKINLLQEVIQEKEAVIAQLRVDVRDKDTEIRQVRMGTGIADLEHEKRRLLEDFHQATRRVDELNDRLVQQARQTEALSGELDAAREAAERKSAAVADVTEHPAFKQKVREIERAREDLAQLQTDLAAAEVKLEMATADAAQQKAAAAELLVLHMRTDGLEAKLHEAESRLNDALTTPKATALADDLAEDIENLLDVAVASRSNAAVVRRYVEDLQGERAKWPELADTLELVNDIAAMLATDLADQARTIAVLHRQIRAPGPTSTENGTP